MDVAMPVLDGVQAARLLKASPVTHDITVVVYSAKLHVEDAPDERLFAGILHKPARPRRTSFNHRRSPDVDDPACERERHAVGCLVPARLPPAHGARWDWNAR